MPLCSQALMPALALAFLACMACGVATVGAQAASPSGGSASDQPLSAGAAAGIAVAVSVTVCVAIAAVIICLLMRRHDKKSTPARRTLSAIYDDGNRVQIDNKHGNGVESQSVIRFVEEGSGLATESAATGRGRERQQITKLSADSENDVHIIAARVSSPDDLRFKLVRRDGQILVATDPAHSSLCSKEGVRTGDRILGVYVNIRDASGAHPKEVSELLSLCSDYGLIVEFEHRGPLMRGGGPPDPASAMNGGCGAKRPISAAEKALRKQRDRPVEVVDGEADADAIDGDRQPVLPERHYAAVSSRSQKQHAPAPPQSEDDEDELQIGIRDRRQLVTWGEVDDHEDADDEDGLNKFVESLALAEGDEDQDIEESLAAQPQFVPKLSSGLVVHAPQESVSWPTRFKVERIFDHYELEEQDVVAAMAPPSAERPVVDGCSQFSGRSKMTRLETPQEWDCLSNLPLSARTSVENEPLVGLRRDAAAAADTTDGGGTAQDGEEDQGGSNEKRLANLLLSMSSDSESADRWDKQHFMVGRESEAEAEAESEAEAEAESEAEAEDIQAETEIEEGVLQENQTHVKEALASSFAATDANEDFASRDPQHHHHHSAEEDYDRELSNYLKQQQQQIRAAAEDDGDSTAPSSALTVQEEAVVEIRLSRGEEAAAAAAAPRRQESLIELEQSLALSDVEVATVILLDSEARLHGREAAGDASLAQLTASSSGRSTVQEDSIRPKLAIDGRPLSDDEPPEDGPDADDGEYLQEGDEVDGLNEDFDLAAAEWIGEVGEDDNERQSPLLDANLVNEIVEGTHDIWAMPAQLQDEEGAINFHLDDSDLSGENLNRLLARLEGADEY